MNDFLELTIRTGVAFILFMIIARYLGKTAISQMTLHDFIAAVTLGGITANLAFNMKIDMLHISYSLIMFGIFAILVTWLSLKSRHARKWLSGHPTVVIEDGKILEENMRKNKFTLDSLIQGLREKDIFDIQEVEFATIESDGHLSVLKKPDFRPVTRRDLALYSNKKEVFPIELVMDGKIVEKNLIDNNISMDWLLNEFSIRNLTIDQVFYAVLSTNQSLYIDSRNDHLKQLIDKE